MRTFDKVIPLLKKSWHKIFLGIVVLVFVDAVQLIIPKVIQKTVDNFGVEGFTQSEILRSSLFIAALAISIIIFRYLWRMLIIGNSWEIDRDLRQDYFNHLLRLSQNFFNKSKTGDLMAYATNDLNAVRMLMGIGFVAGADIFIMTISSFALMAFINLRLTLLTIIPMPLLSISIYYFGKLMHKQFLIVQDSFSSLSGYVQESISGIRVIKAFVQEKADYAKVAEQSDIYCDENIKLARLDGTFHPLLRTIVGLSIVIVLFFGGIDVIRHKITIGEFIAFNAYLGMLVWPMIAIGWIVSLYQRGTASLKRINTIFEIIPEVNDNDADHNIKKIEGNITIEKLSFQYTEDTPLIFNNISTSIETGKTLAIVGKTGCGKSTFVDLLCRVYNPPVGSVFIDGKDIYRFPLQLLRESIIMVPQEIFLFSDTIANNIRLGKPAATMIEIETAAKQAQVYNDIMEFERKFDTMIGERGVTLSGGQKQRVAIARALLCNPPVLILDDSLSAVDTETERNILEHLIEFRKNKTTIIISHRISSISHAERIIVIDGHKIVETGTHKELIDLGRIYKYLYDKQKLKEKLDEFNGNVYVREDQVQNGQVKSE